MRFLTCAKDQVPITKFIFLLYKADWTQSAIAFEICINNKQVNMLKISLIALLAVFAAVNCVTLFNYATLDYILDNYDSRVRPFAEEGKPVVVECSLYVARAYNFDEVDHEFKADLYFRQKWTDPRLTFTAKNANDSFKSNHKLAEKIWTPDTFFPYSHSNDKLNDLTVPNVLLRIKPDGEVFHSGR